MWGKEKLYVTAAALKQQTMIQNICPTFKPDSSAEPSSLNVSFIFIETQAVSAGSGPVRPVLAHWDLSSFLTHNQVFTLVFIHILLDIHFICL